MKTVEKICPHCNNKMEYWTKSKFIICPRCNSFIEVEPCKEEVEEMEEMTEEELTKEEDE